MRPIPRGCPSARCRGQQSQPSASEGEQIVSPRTASEDITPTDDNIEPATEAQFAEDSVQTSATSDSIEAISMDSRSVAVVDESPTDAAAASESLRGIQDASVLAESESQAKP